jgi:uncharacterized protein (DUF342 family)
LAYAHGTGGWGGGHMTGSNNSGHMMGRGMMGYGECGMMDSGHMGGHGMMGQGGYGMRWYDAETYEKYQENYNKNQEEYQKFLDETASLRKKLHNKKFDYSEAIRNPDTTRATMLNIEKEILDLKWEIYQKSQR